MLPTIFHTALVIVFIVLVVALWMAWRDLNLRATGWTLDALAILGCTLLLISFAAAFAALHLVDGR